jgi:hypothetical protein
MTVQETFFWLETRSLRPKPGAGFRALTKSFLMHRFIPLTCFFLLALAVPAFSQEQLTPKGGYSTDANEEHYFLFVLANRPTDLPELRGAITKYMWKQYPNQRLKITQIQVDGELTNTPLLHIQSFSNKAAAMEFYDSLKKNKPDFLQMGMTLDYFALSKSNYEAILRNKNMKGYKAFFEQFYLSSK